VFPSIPPGGDPLAQPRAAAEDRQDDRLRYPLSVSNLSHHDTEHEMGDPENEKTNSQPQQNSSILSSQQIVVKIEVEDTGYGIRPCDMHKLFSKLHSGRRARVND
jgi:hypothetical protein